MRFELLGAGRDRQKSRVCASGRAGRTRRSRASGYRKRRSHTGRKTGYIRGRVGRGLVEIGDDDGPAAYPAEFRGQVGVFSRLRRFLSDHRHGGEDLRAGVGAVVDARLDRSAAVFRRVDQTLDVLRGKEDVAAEIKRFRLGLGELDPQVVVGPAGSGSGDRRVLLQPAGSQSGNASTSRPRPHTTWR